MTEMERVLFKSVSDGFPACSASKKEMELIDEPIHCILSFFFRFAVCVLFDSLSSCWGDISSSRYPFAVTQRSSAALWLWMSSLGYISFIFLFFFFSTKLALSLFLVSPQWHSRTTFMINWCRGILCGTVKKRRRKCHKLLFWSTKSEMQHCVSGERERADRSISICCVHCVGVEKAFDTAARAGVKSFLLPFACCNALY